MNLVIMSSACEYLKYAVVTAAILFLGPSGFGRASVGRTTRGSGLGWLLRTKSPAGSSATAAEVTGVIASAAPAVWRKSRRDGGRPSGMSPCPRPVTLAAQRVQRA